MHKWLAANREVIERDLAESPRRRYFSPVFLAQYQVIGPMIQRYARGRVIDLGCGTMPFKGLLEAVVDEYHTLDLRPRSEGVTYIGDIQDMPMVPAAGYDVAICLEVLEHLPAPHRAMREMYRILKDGGTLIISVPHLSRLHDQPHDYFRCTGYGLRHLLESAGFDVLEIQQKGGLLCFLGHQVSTLLLCAVWSVRGLRQIAWFLNKWVITSLCYWADCRLDRSGLFPLGYAAVACKGNCDPLQTTEAAE